VRRLALREYCPLFFKGSLMSENLEQKYRPLLEAVSFASRAHHGQMRKDGKTPYVSHVFRVCLIVRDVFGITDAQVLTAALLHDTIEDTTTDFDDVEERFGREVATWAAALSKDKRRPYEEREAAYCRELAAAPWQVQVGKLADVFDNLLDMGYLPRDKRLDALGKKQRYLDALRSNLKPEAASAWERTSRLAQELAAKLRASDR
jgi:guanosine-3',5'-bis(diphosphate) 3'-pyrophosphohydrolase